MLRIAIIVTLVLAASARADDAKPTSGATPSTREAWGATGTFLPLKPVRFALGIGSGIGWLRKRTSEEQSVSGSGPTFHMMLGLVIKDVFTVSGAGGALFPTDDKSFTEVVMPVGGGDPMTVSSNLQVARYSVSLGLRTPFLVLSASERIAGAVFVDLAYRELPSNARSWTVSTVDMKTSIFQVGTSAAWGSTWGRLERGEGVEAG